MNYNKETDSIFCHVCNEWRDRKLSTYNFNDEIRCLSCDTDDGLGALLGYRWDFPTWVTEEENIDAD